MSCRQVMLMHCRVSGWMSQNCDNIQVPINGATSRCRRALLPGSPSPMKQQYNAPGRLSHTCIDSAEESTGITLSGCGSTTAVVSEKLLNAQPGTQNASLLVRRWPTTTFGHPWTPDSLTLVSEMTDQKSLYRACNRHLSWLGYFYCWFVKTSTSYRYLHCC